MSTPTFHHTDPGTDESTWSDFVRAARVVHVGDLLRAGRLVVVAPHPDDESLGAGGLIASCSAAGAEVTVVVCSDGRGAAGSTDQEADLLAARRRREIGSAVVTLSVGAPVRLVQLGLSDGTLSEQVDHLADLLAPVLAAADVVVGPWPGDGHPDHAAVGDAVRRVAADQLLLEYPVWAWHWGTPALFDGAGRALRVPLSPSAQRVKGRAISCHESQVGGPDPIVTAPVRTHFERADEVFLASPTTVERLPRPSRSSSEFFDGLYRSTPSGDPWDFGVDHEQLRRVDAVVEVLGDLTFDRCLEIGCATGEMTSRLLDRSRHVTAVDTSTRAIEVARARAGDRDGLELRVAHLPDDLGDHDHGFDLVVISDVGYYFTEADLEALVVELARRCAPDARVLASHWTGHSDDHLLDGPTTHATIARTLGWSSEHHTRLDCHLVDLWSRS